MAENSQKSRENLENQGKNQEGEIGETQKERKKLGRKAKIVKVKFFHIAPKQIYGLLQYWAIISVDDSK